MRPRRGSQLRRFDTQTLQTQKMRKDMKPFDDLRYVQTLPLTTVTNENVFSFFEIRSNMFYWGVQLDVTLLGFVLISSLFFSLMQAQRCFFKTVSTLISLVFKRLVSRQQFQFLVEMSLSTVKHLNNIKTLKSLLLHPIFSWQMTKLHNSQLLVRRETDSQLVKILFYGWEVVNINPGYNK